MGWWLVYACICAYLAVHLNCQLVVNVRNEGGETLRESILANVSEDTVNLDLYDSDGTLITQFIDFTNEIQIMRAVVLGEEERGQTGVQVLCFVSRFVKNDFISSDAMSKLRQKNPDAIRHPEEDKGQEVIAKDLILDLTKSDVISPYIATVCAQASDATYASDSDFKILSKTVNKEYDSLLGTSKRMSTHRVAKCRDVTEPWRSCTCQYEICIGWYPCGLKYCRGQDSGGKLVSYRCGIKTCRKCRVFEYLVRQKQMCLWDDLVHLQILFFGTIWCDLRPIHDRLLKHKSLT